MRLIVSGLGLMLAAAFTLATVPAAQAQQSLAPVSASQAEVVSTQELELRSAERGMEVQRVGVTRPQTTQAGSEMLQTRGAVAESAAAQDTSARTVLAVIGAIVVVVALIALLK